MLKHQAKLTKSVHRSLILITSLLLVSSLTGCANFSWFGKQEKPIEVVAKPIEKQPLDINNPDPLKFKPIQWVVVTPDNAEEIFAEMQKKEQNLVLFALTDDGYQQLALTIADLRNFINTQKTIIIKYKEYYEPSKEDVKEEKGKKDGN